MPRRLAVAGLSAVIAAGFGAASAAFVDTTALAGSALVLVALTDFRGADPVLVLVLVLAVAWVDVLARLAVLRRAQG
ncbi:hypothetical protein [Cellulomonas hominis]